MLSPTEYYQYIKTHFEEMGDPEIAEKQMKYLKYKFEYYGIKHPVWGPVSKKSIKEKGLFIGEDLKTFTRLCMEDEYREMHYMGLMMVQEATKKRRNGWTPPADFIDFYEELILTNSWWDSVDWIKNFVSRHFLIHPEVRDSTIEKWMASEEFWLQRVCLIFQLTYKNDTDAELLFNLIRRLKHSDEFFIQKAAGWSLRQYSKYNPDAVAEFIDETDGLPKLTIREGLKYLKKNGLI